MERLENVVNFEFSYETVHLATSNLQGLHWDTLGGNVFIEILELDIYDMFSLYSA